VAALVAQAERGTKLLVVLDDAYFGLFDPLGGASMTESLFGRLANRHPNLLAIRLDGATKELFVWGLRCGFVTFDVVVHPARATRPIATIFAARFTVAPPLR
jgi:aspartate/methionine/tyrosine aminotransferase